jgi:small subunit ribosomal protein S17
MSEDTRNSRKVIQGRVVSDKMDKTIVVIVETYKNHPVYGKRVRYSKKFKAHDEKNEAKNWRYRQDHGNSSSISY